MPPWGLGVWTPETTRISGGFYKEPGEVGAEDESTGYLAPNRHEIFDHNIVFDYRYELILGTLDEIRSHCGRNADTNLLPHWEFASARHGWYFAGASDDGWPILGQLDIRPNSTGCSNDIVVENSEPTAKVSAAAWQIVSPEFFLRGDNPSKLVLEAAFENTGNEVSLLSRELEGWNKWQLAQTISIIPRTNAALRDSREEGFRQFRRHHPIAV